MASAAPTLSPLSTLISSTKNTTTGSSPSPYTALAVTIQHGLQHQHYWKDLTLHTHSPLDPAKPLARPLLSGLPPTRLYVHPDDQAEELQQEARRKQGEAAGQAGIVVEREWVLPTHLREHWSLAKFAEIFDVISEHPPAPDEPEPKSDGQDEAGDAATSSRPMPKPRKGGKRLLLAILSEDSAVSFYIVHDGIVKPRQN